VNAVLREIILDVILGVGLGAVIAFTVWLALQ